MNNVKPPTEVKFRYIDPATDNEYRGLAHINRVGTNEDYEDGKVWYDASIQELWFIGLTAPEKVDYADLTPTAILDLERAAVEHYNDPPDLPVELPSEWDFEVVDVEYTVIIKSKKFLLTIDCQSDVNLYKLKVIRRIKCIRIENKYGVYKVNAKGDLGNIIAELKRITVCVYTRYALTEILNYKQMLVGVSCIYAVISS